MSTIKLIFNYLVNGGIGLMLALTAARTFPAPIVTQVVPLPQFYPAESYHQDYLARHPYQPYIVFHDMPKLKQLRAQFPTLYR